MLQYLPSPRLATFIVTNQCNANCAHCISSSAPERSDRLSLADMKNVVDQLCETHPPTVICFSGGEPTLLKDDLLEAIAYVADKGIVTRVVTNAKWAKSVDIARRRLIELRECGLAEINFSCDDYHLPDIPIERVKHAWEASKGLGFLAVVLANAHGPGSKINPEFLQEYLGERIPFSYDDEGAYVPEIPRSEDGTMYLISNTMLNILGRAQQFVPIERVRSRSPDRFIGHCHLAWRDIAITPTGEVGACCGCEIETNPVLRVGRFDQPGGIKRALERANDNIFIVAISTLGPAYLKEIVERKAPHIRWRNHYNNVCEMCEEVTARAEVVQVLRDNIPELVAAIMQVAPRGHESMVAQVELAATRDGAYP